MALPSAFSYLRRILDGLGMGRIPASGANQNVNSLNSMLMMNTDRCGPGSDASLNVPSPDISPVAPKQQGAAADVD
jgi:hypothetical protein